MPRIYLSPSTQEANQYAGGATGYSDSEEYWCRKCCAEIEDFCRTATKPDGTPLGLSVRVGGSASAGANASDSNAWGATYHIAVHTNAGGGRGSEVWYYTGSAKGATLAKNVYAPVAAESNQPDRGVKTSTAYIELNKTKAPAIIVEILFHDNPTEAAEMRVDHKKFALAIAKGIAKTCGGVIPTPAPVVPKPPTTPTVPPPADTTPAKSWVVASQTDGTITLERR